LAIGSSTACATKKFVRTSVGEVNQKVDSLGRSVEETQERTKQNEAKIAEVDQRAQAAAQAASSQAQAAGQAADKAGQAATMAASSATTANTKADALDKASKRLVYEVVLSEDEGEFEFGKKALPDSAKVRLDEMISKLKADPQAAYFEIEGHTDSIGAPELNEKLGLDRAEVVKRYLYEHHQIPLHKMNAISYGEDKPIAENKTKTGRAQNRRVVIKVLA
jgi:outer membrane protein OmpA-like peptidoglycan-associated protein